MAEDAFEYDGSLHPSQLHAPMPEQGFTPQLADWINSMRLLTTELQQQAVSLEREVNALRPLVGELERARAEVDRLRYLLDHERRGSWLARLLRHAAGVN